MFDSCTVLIKTCEKKMQIEIMASLRLDAYIGPMLYT